MIFNVSDNQNNEIKTIEFNGEGSLRNSYAGGIKITPYGNTEQDGTNGYQLFDASNAILNAVINSGVLETSTSYKIYAVAVTVGNTYTLAKDVLETASYIGFCSEIPTIGATLTGMTNIQSLEELTFTATDNYLCLEFNVNADLSSIMLNAGTVALPWEKYTGGQASPSPDYPQEIKSVKGKNLLDCRGLTEQTISGIKYTPVKDEHGNLLYVEANGKASANSVLIVGKFTANKGTEYIMSGCPAGGTAETYRLYADNMATDYGNGKTFIKDSETTSNVAIFIASGATVSNLRFYPMIRKATIADDTYVPYGLLRFKAHGKNLINQACVPAGSTPKHWLKAGTYTASRDASECGNAWYLRAMDDNGYVITARALVTDTYVLNGDSTWYYGGAPYKSCTFAVKEDCYVQIASLNGSGTTYLMLNEGTEALPYEPYTENSITLSKPITLNGINDIRDGIVERDGVYEVERKFGKFVFDGTEDIIVQSTDNNDTTYFLCNVAPVKINASSETKVGAFCNRLIEKIPNHLWWYSDVGFSINATEWNPIRFRLGANISDVETAKAKLAEWYETGNPMVLYYPLAQPTFEPLPTADQIALRSLKSYDGVTYISCDSEVEPLIVTKYGTSEVGALSLENSNLHGINEVLIDNCLTAKDFTVSGDTLILNFL